MRAPAVAAAMPASARQLRVDFDNRMARLGPFEPQPHLAVAVSGGGDSMALALLADAWAREQDGRITALTVDHGLRPEAAAEARQVASWCAARSIDHAILRGREPLGAHGIQAAARALRYALLEDWCRANFVLHLLLAHQREDQAETAAIRDASGSGLDGLSAMPGVSEHGAVRLLRPVLDQPPQALRQLLVGEGQRWIEDPSNHNPAFTRVRIRNARTEIAAASAEAHRSAAVARLGRARAEREIEDASRLARWVMLHPAGFAWVDPQGFGAVEGMGLKAFGALLAAVSGREYPPRRERIARLYRELVDAPTSGRCLGGCFIAPRRGKILICREPAAVAPPVALARGMGMRWDGRYDLFLDPAAPAGLCVGALGADAPWIREHLAGKIGMALPATVRAGLPALRDGKHVVAVPLLGYFGYCREEAMQAACRVRFRPDRSLTGAGFRIV